MDLGLEFRHALYLALRFLNWTVQVLLKRLRLHSASQGEITGPAADQCGGQVRAESFDRTVPIGTVQTSGSERGWALRVGAPPP